MQAARDDNDSPTLIGVSSVDGVTPVRAKVDPVTGYVLMTIQRAAFSTTAQTPKIDDNDIPVTRAVTNNASQAVKPLISDPNYPGYVLADVLQI